MNPLGKTYEFMHEITEDLLNQPRFYELQFMQTGFAYEKELGLTMLQKIQMLDRVMAYLEERNIYVTFTDRIKFDGSKPWELKESQEWRFLPIAELIGNNICVNPREIDFLSVLMSIGHIYGHLVQRTEEEKYRPITEFLEWEKPLDLNRILAQYQASYGRSYKDDFFAFETEAFQYAKYTFMEAGIVFDENLDYAMNVYLWADFNELWGWVSSSPQKSGKTFMDEFERLWAAEKGSYKPLEPKPIHVKVEPAKNGRLTIVRDTI
jgi:hypothetical protein